MDKRIERDKLMLQVCKLIAKRTTCKRLPEGVGCVITQENRIVSSGYNGSLPGEDHCGEQCDLNNTCKFAVHAEINAIGFAAKQGVNLKGATLYVTHSPCETCSGLIIQAGITRVVFENLYRINDHLPRLNGQGVATLHLP